MEKAAKKKIYIAGDMIFRKNGIDMYKRMKAICNKHGIEGLGPWDGQKSIEGLPPDTPGLTRKITDCDEKLMRDVDGAVFCLDGARGGADMDAGTAYEVGYMSARGKVLSGFTSDVRKYSERVSDMFDGDLRERPLNEEGASSGGMEDPNGVMVHSDGLHQNAMVVEGIRKNGGEIYADKDFFKAFEDTVVKIADSFKKAEKEKVTVSASDFEKEEVGTKGKKHVYLAGDIIFRKDGMEKYKRMKAICNKYGFEGLGPWDGQKSIEGLPPDTPGLTRKITDCDEKLMRNVDGAIFCLDGARGGADMDAGTAYEVGYMASLGGKELNGFTSDTRKYSERVSDMFNGELKERPLNEEGASSGGMEDPNGVMVHSDGLHQNAMVVEGIQKNGGKINADEDFFKAFENSAKQMGVQLGVYKEKANVDTKLIAAKKKKVR